MLRLEITLPYIYKHDSRAKQSLLFCGSYSEPRHPVLGGGASMGSYFVRSTHCLIPSIVSIFSTTTVEPPVISLVQGGVVSTPSINPSQMAGRTKTNIYTIPITDTLGNI